MSLGQTDGDVGNWRKIRVRGYEKRSEMEVKFEIHNYLLKGESEIIQWRVQKIIVDAVNKIRGLTIRKAESKLLFANFR